MKFMKINSLNLPQSRFRLTVELTIDEVSDHFDRALANLTPMVKIPGFRSGKAPTNLVKEQIDPTKLREEAYTLVVQASWKAVTKQLATSNWQTGQSPNQKSQKPGARSQEPELPISDPEVSIEHFEEGQESKVVFEFDIRPEVKVGNWADIKLSRSEEEEVTDKDVEELIDSLRRAHAKTVAKLTPAALGDKVHVDFEGSLGGIRQTKLSSKNFPLVIGLANTIPGFDEQLVGLKKGDKKKFQIKFPKDHFDKELAEKLVDFEAEVTEVFDVILPELNDEFAQGFGHNKAEQLKKAIKEDIGSRKKEERFVSQKARWLAEFEKLVNCELPESLLIAEVERSRQAWRAFLQERHINEGEWLMARKLTLRKLERDWQQTPEASVRIGLGLAEVAKVQKKELKSNEEFQTLLDGLVRKTIK